MKKILRFIFVVLLLSGFVSGALFVWSNQDHYFLSELEDTFKYPSNYNVSAINTGTYEVAKIPELPDISSYTLESIQNTIPDFDRGAIRVVDLKKGYPKLRSRVAYYGDLQGRLDPLSIVVSSGVVSLSDIAEQVSDKTLIESRGDNTFILHVPLSVKSKATLVIQKGETLLISANEGAMVAVLGKAYALGTTIMGWDVVQDQPAYYKSPQKFRPYFVAWCGSTLNIANSYVAYLGYEHPKSYGVSYSSCENDKYIEQGVTLASGTGIVLNNIFEGLYFGFYSYESDGIAVIGNTYKDNIVYGIDPHDRSKNLIIADNVISGTKEKHGIIVSREVSDSYIFNNVSENNAGTGIMIDRASHNNFIAKNIVRNNGGDGLSFYESSNNFSYKNALIGNKNSGMRIRNSVGIKSVEDIINGNHSHALEMYTQNLEGRDVNVDTYTEQASVKLIDSEIVGNKRGVFKLEKIDSFTLISPRLYESPQAMFSGDFTGSLKKNSDTSNGLSIERIN